MIPRTLEPKVMDSADEARDYDAMDHSAVNDAFVADFLSALDAFGVRGSASDQRVTVLDAGTGTALIPIALAQRHDSCVVTAVDLSEEMLGIARRNIEAARLDHRIELSIADCKALRLADGSFDAVMSNSIIHHLSEPAGPLTEMARVVRRGGLLFLRDLLRPDSIGDVERLVDMHAAHEAAHARQLFRDSLHAALTLEEVRHALATAGLSPSMARQTSDRHWTATGLVH